MGKKVVYAKNLVLENHMLKDFAVVFSDKVLEIIPKSEAISQSLDSVGEFEYVLPGFIDVHIHGSAGADVMDASLESLETISRAITKSGTTSFLPTTMTMAEDKICLALENIREAKRVQDETGETKGARILGAHLEGPFISVHYKGAQDPQHIQKPNDRWLKNYYDIVKLITMAAEEDDNFAMIKEWSSRGIVVSLGHTNADYETALLAYDAGARHITHLFNAMTPIHHRKPGMVTAALNKDFNVEMITDGFHIRPEVINLVSRAKSKDQIILITDCMRAGFMGDGESELGGQKVYVKGDQCLLESGTIAGSIHRMDKALRNVLDFTECTLIEVSKMLSLNPARDLGIDSEYGSIEVGKFADFVCMDLGLEVNKTIVSGQTMYEVE